MSDTQAKTPAKAPAAKAPAAKGGASKASQAAQKEAMEKELFSKYLGAVTSMVCDPNGSSRVRLANILNQLGAKTHNIVIVGTYAEAMDAIEKRKPKIILCEFDLGGGISGLDLLQEQRKANPNGKDCVFALITGNTSQSAVASAAEEDVDTFIIKPYTLDSLKRTLTSAAVAKLHPNDYVKTIEAGKVLLFKGDIEPAIKQFEAAMKLHDKPALACFYKAQAETVRAALESASKDYKTGLNVNKIHYKCLIGLYELRMQRKEYKDAYDVVKKVAQYFPANPKRLASVLRLAIMTSSYEDIEGYYRIFTMIENRNDELVRYICSALIVTGKYYLMNSYNSRAIELLQKAAVSSAGKASFLRYIIEVLVEFDKFDDANEVLQRFPAASKSEADYLSMELLVAAKSLETGMVIQKGRALLKAGIESTVIYEIMIAASIKAGLEDSAGELLSRAVKKFPEGATKFQLCMERKDEEATA